jgi:hypothetical protein
MLTSRDWAPLIVAAVMAVNGLFFLWLAVRQAHSGERNLVKAAPEPKRSRRRGLAAPAEHTP